jgi:uncharacterized membrane protein YdbT with pleckstrin-like domain
MAYPEEVLGPDEELLLHTHPHPKMLVAPALVFLIGTAVAGFAAGLAAGHLGDPTLRQGALIAVGVLWLLLVITRCTGRLIEWKSTHFVITNRRVLVREGVLTHTGRDIPLSRISSVQFRNGLLDRMVGTGTLIIDSSSQEPLEYDDIPQVEQVHSLLYHEVFESARYD